MEQKYKKIRMRGFLSALFHRLLVNLKTEIYMDKK